MNTKKIFKVVGLLAAGGIAGWLKGICDTAYYVGKGDITQDRCATLTKAVDDLKSAVTKGTKTTEEVAEDITEMVSDAAEEVAASVEEAVSEVVPDIEVTTNDSKEESDQPED